MCNGVSTLKISSIGNFRHRNLKNIYFFKDRQKLLTNGIFLNRDDENTAKLLELVLKTYCRQDKRGQKSCPVAWLVYSQLFC